MSMSVSLKKATNKTNIKHNNRTMSDKEKEQNKHIDTSRSDKNKYLVQEDIKKIYEREFGEALEKYNAKQTRSDRKINNYYKHIEASKKTATQQELIIQVGDKDDFASKEYFALANEILEEWFRVFEKRNVNLKVYNAVIHNDEVSPHMHLNFVPVANGYKRGLEKQVAFDRAIKQQDATLDKKRPFQDWREKEVGLLAEMLKERGVERKLVGTNTYKDVNEYKEKKDLEREVKRLEKDLSEKKNELLAFSKNVPNEVKVPAKRQMKNVEIPTGEKNLFGKIKTKTEARPTKNVIISETDNKKLVSASRDNKKIKGHLNDFLSTDSAQENTDLRKYVIETRRDNVSLRKANQQLRGELTEAHQEMGSLKAHINDLKQDVRLIYQSTKDFLKERTDGLKAFKNAFKDLVDKVKGKTSQMQEGQNLTSKMNEFERIHKIELKKERNRGLER